MKKATFFKMESIAIQAIFNKATTTIDGGWNITFSVSEDQAGQITEIAALRNEPLYLVIMTEKEYSQSK